MKRKILLLSLFILLFFSYSYSQEYHPFLNNSSWKYDVYTFGGPQSYTIEPDIDVVIGNNTYKKFIDSRNAEEIYLREDVANKKVYKRINGIDTILFDFNLQVGSTVTLNNGTTYYVNLITMVNVNGGQRKKFTLQQSNPFSSGETWIEGVGNIEHPLIDSYILSDPTYSLKCSFQNDINVYNFGIANGGTPTQCSTLSTNEIQIPNFITYSPNPFNDELTITTTKKLSNSSLKVYNSIGQLVKKVENIYGNKVTLQRENLVSGIYFVQLFEKDKLISTQKIISKD